jgi:hypothetical protein
MGDLIGLSKLPHGRAVAGEKHEIASGLTSSHGKTFMPSSAVGSSQSCRSMGGGALGQVSALPGNWKMDSGHRSSNLAPISTDSWRRLLHLNKNTLAVFDRPAMWPRKQFRAFENHAGTSLGVVL